MNANMLALVIVGICIGLIVASFLGDRSPRRP